MEEDPFGTSFIDPYCDIEDSKNIVIYGHFLYPDVDPLREERFTPLASLQDEANYEENKYFYLLLEDEIRKYEIAHIYIAQQSNDPINPLEEGMYYMRPDWSYNEMVYYIDGLNEKEEYDTGISLSPDDKFVTFICCVENDDFKKQATIAREIAVYEY